MLRRRLSRRVQKETALSLAVLIIEPTPARVPPTSNPDPLLSESFESSPWVAVLARFLERVGQRWSTLNFRSGSGRKAQFLLLLLALLS